MATDWAQPIPYREDGVTHTFKHRTVDLSLDQADSHDFQVPAGKRFFIKRLFAASSINFKIEMQIEKVVFETEFLDFVEGGKDGLKALFSDEEGQGIEVESGKLIHFITTGRNDTEAADVFITLIGVLKDND